MQAIQGLVSNVGTFVTGLVGGSLETLQNSIMHGPSPAEAQRILRAFDNQYPGTGIVTQVWADWPQLDSFQRQLILTVIDSFQRQLPGSLMQTSAGAASGGFLDDLLRLTNAMCQNSARASASRNPSRLMRKNIGWDHVWSGMRAKGYRR